MWFTSRNSAAQLCVGLAVLFLAFCLKTCFKVCTCRTGHSDDRKKGLHTFDLRGLTPCRLVRCGLVRCGNSLYPLDTVEVRTDGDMAATCNDTDIKHWHVLSEPTAAGMQPTNTEIKIKMKIKRLTSQNWHKSRLF